MAPKVDFTLGLIDNFTKVIDGVKVNSEKAFSSISDSIKKVNDNISGLNAAIGVLGSSAALKKIIDSKSEIDKVKLSLNTVFGSQNGGELFKDLENLRENSQLSRESLKQEAISLDGYGISVDKISSTLKQLSDVSLGNEATFATLSESFGKVAVNGNLGTRELMAMQKSGFFPLHEIAMKTGESLESVTERMKKGNFTFKEVETALTAVTSAGGRFAGSTDLIAQVVGERMNTQLARIPLIMAKIGDSLEGKISKMLDFFEKLTSNILDSTSSFDKIVPFVFNFISVLGAATLGVKAFNLVASINPFVAITGGIVALIAYLIEAIDWTDRFAKIFQSFNFNNFTDGILLIGKLILEVIVKSLLKVADVAVSIFDFILPESMTSGMKKAMESANFSVDNFFGVTASGKTESINPTEKFIAAPTKYGANKNLQDIENNALNSVSGGGIKYFNINITELNGLKATNVNTGGSLPEDVGKMVSNALVKEISQFSI